MITTHMHIEDATRFEINKAMATPEIIKLACCLQNLAFYGLRDAITSDPAPLYLQMAVNITMNYHVREGLADLICPAVSTCCCGEC